MNFRCSQDWHSRVSVNRLQEAPLSKRLFQYVSGFPFAWTQMWIGGFRMCLWKGCLDWSWPLDESLLSNEICSEKCLHLKNMHGDDDDADFWLNLSLCEVGPEYLTYVPVSLLCLKLCFCSIFCRFISMCLCLSVSVFSCLYVLSIRLRHPPS